MLRHSTSLVPLVTKKWLIIYISCFRSFVVIHIQLHFIKIIIFCQFWPILSHGSLDRHDPFSLQWRHNENNGVSNHQRLDCLLNRLFRRRSKKTSKLYVTGLCEGKSPVTGEFPAQRASNSEKFPFDDVIMNFVMWLSTAGLSRPPGLFLWRSKVSAIERKLYIYMYNVFSNWLRSCSTAEIKRDQRRVQLT